MDDLTYPDIQVELSNSEANVYSVIASVSRQIRRSYGNEAADKFINEAKSQKSYDDVIQYIMGTVEVL